MGIRARKSFKIAPGLRLNVGKTGVGVSAGGRTSPRVSVHSSGRVTKSASLPGTGIGWVSTSKLGRNAKEKRNEESDESQEIAAVYVDGDFLLEVVGESNYQSDIQRALEFGGEDTVALLVPEPDNPYDPNAVAVYVCGLKVGYLARSHAACYQQGLMAVQSREGKPVACRAEIVGRDIYGVKVYVDPEEIAGPARPSAASTQPPPTSVADAGWFPDPSGKHEYRYWDGAAWTRDVADRGVQSLDD